MTSLYIDFERFESKVIEIGAVLVCDGYVRKEFHYFVERSIINLSNYYKCAENSHCIHPNNLFDMGYSGTHVAHEFEQFISNIGSPFTIKGNGQDVSKEALEQVFPFLLNYSNINYQQVVLQPWKERQYEPYHLAAFTMKTASEIVACTSKNHIVEYKPHWRLKGKAATHTRIAKLCYGHHCALIDCYELAFFEGALELYCCDFHFNEKLSFVTYPPLYFTDI